MSRDTPIRRGLRGTLLTVTVVGLVLAGCSSESSEHDHMDDGGPTGALSTPPPPSLPERFAGTDQTDPESVIVAAAETLFSYDPIADTNQAAAAERAKPLLDEQFYDENTLSFSVLAPISGNRWQQWRDEQAVVTATARITDDDHPADAPARISRVVAVDVVATAPTGREVDRMNWAAYMSATKLGVWRVNAVAVR